LDAVQLGETRFNLEPDSLKNLFIKIWELEVLKCEEWALELDQRFYNIFFKILEPEPRVFQKNKTELGTGIRRSLEN
jgi:hypothetical protein